MVITAFFASLSVICLIVWFRECVYVRVTRFWYYENLNTLNQKKVYLHLSLLQKQTLVLIYPQKNMSLLSFLNHSSYRHGGTNHVNVDNEEYRNKNSHMLSSIWGRMPHPILIFFYILQQQLRIKYKIYELTTINWLIDLFTSILLQM
jgi:hypothetical protein